MSSNMTLKKPRNRYKRLRESTTNKRKGNKLLKKTRKYCNRFDFYSSKYIFIDQKFRSPFLTIPSRTRVVQANFEN